MVPRDPGQEDVRNGDLEAALDRFIDSHRAFLDGVSEVLGSTASTKPAQGLPDESHPRPSTTGEPGTRGSPTNLVGNPGLSPLPGGGE